MKSVCSAIVANIVNVETNGPVVSANNLAEVRGGAIEDCIKKEMRARVTSCLESESEWVQFHCPQKFSN
jgi:hypothetical protein